METSSPKIAFKPHFRVETVPPDMVFLLSEQGHSTLTGRLYYLLAPLLDGRYTQEELAAALDGSASPAQIGYALSRLRRAEYLTDIDGTIPPEQAAFYTLQASEPERLKNASVAVHNFGVGVSEVFERMLLDHHLRIADADANLDVVFVNDYLHPALNDFNRRALERGRAWLLIKPVGAMLWVGPLFLPGETACWECLAQRLRGNRAVERFIETAKGLDEPVAASIAALPATAGLALHIAALEAMQWLTSGKSWLRNEVRVFDTTMSMNQTRHILVQRPQCPVCGARQPAEPTPIVLQPRAKKPEIDGGYRSLSAAETLERYQHHVSSITGAVSRLERVQTPGLIHIYLAGLNRARAFDRWGAVRRGLRSHSAGKGIEEIQAKVSGLCEALERYSGVWQGDEACVIGRIADFDNAIHPRSLVQFSDAQYAEREPWNANCPPHLEIKEPFDDESSIGWSPAWSLTEERFKLVPTAFCYYGYDVSNEPDFCNPDSNGNAAGSSLEDAILQGFLEVVERDAIAIWWDNRIHRAGIDLNGVDSPYLRQVSDYYARINREVWALNISTDLGIPVCVALSRRTDKPAEDIIMGFGAHLHPRVALLRAVTELNQMLPSVITVGDDGSGPYNSESPWELDWWQKATVITEPYLLPDPAHTPVWIGDKHPDNGDLRDDVRLCIDIVRRAGMEILVVDQTRPDIGLPVVKVIVPGMRHFWRRYAPGRLYTVPVKMGWQAKATPEAEMNPRPMTL